MGGQIARRLAKNNFNVLGWNRSPEHRQQAETGGVKTFAEVKDLVESMTESPRVFWIMLPHEIVYDFIFGEQGLKLYLKAGDIVIDGGNSFYKDSIKHANLLRARNIHFFDCGTSGGIWGLENGFSLMVGGPKEQWSKIEPIIKTLSSGDNYGLVGENGAGHFVKMVHNGIEYGMMEAIGEGYGVLQASDFKLDLKQVTKIYQQGTVVRSWLIDLMKDIFEKEDIDATKGEILASGEGEWTVNTAKELGVDVCVIEDALNVRKESSQAQNQQKFSNKIVALLRKQFGGHEVKK